MDTLTPPPTATGPRLDDQLCFALYHATNTIVRAYRPLLADLGLTYPQYLLMMVLWESDAVPLSQLAERLDLPAHGVTPVVNRLVEGGWAVKRPDDRDARVSRVFLTESGRRLEHDAALAQAAVVCRTGLTPDALAALRDQLQALAHATGTRSAPPARPGGQR